MVRKGINKTNKGHCATYDPIKLDQLRVLTGIPRFLSNCCKNDVTFRTYILMIIYDA